LDNYLLVTVDSAAFVRNLARFITYICSFWESSTPI
jgi:hypothetical protein